MEPMTTDLRAAGVMFLTADGRVLLLKRSEERDAEGF